MKRPSTLIVFFVFMIFTIFGAYGVTRIIFRLVEALPVETTE